METITFDVMLHGRFVCTMRCRHRQRSPVSASRLAGFVTARLPSLRGKPFTIRFCKQTKQSTTTINNTHFITHKHRQ